MPDKNRKCEVCRIRKGVIYRMWQGARKFVCIECNLANDGT